jgi:hypothetical protein
VNRTRVFRADRVFRAGTYRYQTLGWLVPVGLAAAAGLVAVATLAGGDERDPVELTSDAPIYTTLGELVAASDIVVVATVGDVADGRVVTAGDDPETGIRTRLVELEVSRSLVGEPVTPLVVEEPAELLDGTPVVVDGMTPLDAGDQAVWFLVAGDGESVPYYAVVNPQGRVAVELEDVIDAVLATR